MIFHTKTTLKNLMLLIINCIVLHKNLIDDNIAKKLCDLSTKNPQLFQVFLYLNERYMSIKKTKEEFSKFLFRKSFKFIKRNLEDKKKGMMKKNIKHLYLETYFTSEQQTGIKDISDLFPFKKNSLIKRINQKYLKMLFGNDNYFKEFEHFLEKYDKFVQAENQKKISKLVKQIMTLVADNKIENIRSIQHFPWLKCWIDSCKKMGDDVLKKMKSQKTQDKKLKF